MREAAAVKLSRMGKDLALVCLAPPKTDRAIEAGFASDVLSDVLAGAPRGCVLVTALNNLNVIAVASYGDLAGVIMTSGRQPCEEVLKKAREEGIGLYTTPAQTFEVVGRLSALGIKGASEGCGTTAGAAEVPVPEEPR